VSTASARAYEIIKTGIVEGRFRPGQRLKEAELTVLCEVSRTPVREALRQLANEGMAKLLPMHGAQVARFGVRELAELYELRAMIEGRAAARAAERMLDATLAELTQLTDCMEAAAASGEPAALRLAPANAEFHRLIISAADSARLKIMAGSVVEAPLSIRTFERYDPAQLERSMRHHRELIQAFAAKDPDWARGVMTSHIRAAFHTISASLAATDAD
jgi:DNA-binding GntR family transcriptional regulator